MEQQWNKKYLRYIQTNDIIADVNLTLFIIILNVNGLENADIDKMYFKNSFKYILYTLSIRETLYSKTQEGFKYKYINKILNKLTIQIQ